MRKIWLALGGRQSPERKARALASGHYYDGKFQNLVPTVTMKPWGFLRLLWRKITGREKRFPDRQVPVVKRSLKDFELAPAEDIRTTWMGHASVLLEFDGIRVLTDPVWSDRVSPFQNIGPKRFYEPPVKLVDLPKIDVVIISHDHYDHLDMNTIIELSKRDLKFITPLGIGAHLELWGVPLEKIIELNWNENIDIKNVKVTLTSARHFSGRRLIDADQTMWGSFALAGRQFKIFYSGDTGPLDHFKVIGEQHGPFDLTLMQIGACSKSWPEIHMTPKEAVNAHLQLKGKLLIPVHWGTFNLANHSWNAPALWLKEAAEEMNVEFRIPKPGEFVFVGEETLPSQEDWWAGE